MAKYYDFLLKSPILLAIVAIAAWAFTGIDIFRQIPIFFLIGIFYTFKNKEIMTKKFKLDFALYFIALLSAYNFLVLFIGLLDPLSEVGIVTSLPSIIIIFPLQLLFAFISSYLVLLISNRMSLLLVKISELQNWLKYIVKPIISLVEQPKYLLSLMLLVFLLNFTYSLIFYENGQFKSVGKLNNHGQEIMNIFQLPNGNIFILYNGW